MTLDILWTLGRYVTSSRMKFAFTSVAEFDRAKPLEGWLPASLLTDVHLLDEGKAGQDVGNIV